MNELKLFESQYIRSAWNPDEDQWYYSVIDVIAALTDSKNPSAYWRKLKQRLSEEGNETVTNCHKLKLEAADGKMRLTDVANTEQLLRIIQSVPSPKAEPFKLWLAQTGADHLMDLADAKKLQEELNTRMQARDDVREHNKSLAKAAQDAGVSTNKDFAKFQNSGYMGLYNGETAAAIKRRKGLKKSEDILDNMGSEELGANLFRITQAEAKLKRENIQSKEDANKAHFEVGYTVRKAIESLGGTMPEDLPTPDKSIKQIEREQKKPLKINKEK